MLPDASSTLNQKPVPWDGADLTGWHADNRKRFDRPAAHVVRSVASTNRSLESVTHVPLLPDNSRIYTIVSKADGR